MHACIYCAYIRVTYLYMCVCAPMTNVSESSMTATKYCLKCCNNFILLGSDSSALGDVLHAHTDTHTHTHTHTHTNTHARAHTHTHTHTHKHTHTITTTHLIKKLLQRCFVHWVNSKLTASQLGESDEMSQEPMRQQTGGTGVK